MKNSKGNRKTRKRRRRRRRRRSYAYRAGFINTYINWEPTALEKIECLEQLRVLWYGEKIHVEVAKEAPSAGVDTPEDLEVVRNIIANQ